MRKLLLFFSILTVTGCSFKTVVHPLPYQYDGNPDEATDRFEIHDVNDYIFIDPDTSARLPLSYSNGSLYVLKWPNNDPAWTKNDHFINPISKIKYTVNASVKYNSDVEADEFTVTMNEGGSDSVFAFIEGLVEDATVYYGENIFRYSALNFWEPEVKKVKGPDGTEWHHFPHGGTWSISFNDVIIGEIIQGSPVIDKSGIKANYGVSYTFLFIETIDEALKTDFINTFITYLALVDMEFYYYECDPYYPKGEACPGSIKIR
tara:strand:- start:25544 stop:26329 length:786 start_codon:yes stop_codon:yes gene_type:complete